MRRRGMSFFAKNLLFTSINIVLVGVILIVSSYLIQRNVLVSQLHNQIETITGKWNSQIVTSEVQTAVQEKSYEGPVQTKIRAMLDQVSKYNPNIAQAYIFGTELQDGNKTSVVAMPTHVMEMLVKDNLLVGTMYEQPTEIAETVKEMIASGKPELSDFYKDDYGTWVTIVYPLKDSSGKIFAYFGVDTDASLVEKGMNSLILYSLLIMAVFMVITLVAQYLIARKTLSPIKNLMQGIDLVSEGRLDVEIATGTDDLGLINEKFNLMVQKMNETMLKVQETSHQVADSAKALYSNSDRSSKSAENIGGHIKEIAGSIKVQEQSSFEASRAISEMASVIQMIATNSADVSDEAYAVEKKSIQGDEVVQTMADQMLLITQTVKSTSVAVNSLEKRSQEIGSILEMITGIANQTNLLALNAAIEAARVGEHGKGFAVVAGEVRKLAEQSQSSANQISVLIKEIQSEIRSAAVAMDQGTHVVEKGMQVAEATGQLFSEIRNATKRVSSQIQEVSAAAQQISAGTDEISATAGDLTTSVSKTAASASEIAQSIDEQKQYMESIVDASNTLSDMSQDLKGLLEQFHVKKN
ncbi:MULTISPECIES: methyl-accepting chemotaxis protein [Paenibacillus]|uniref:methyl-accepting chemotaxis protein n=1 Tax=Paenibacillus TaxID=44249 RepID=UPI0022B8BA32|nr:methyl-accepting chemotaxis protein [Paenibacillus caseinilyticus]MCZ8523838.1 methyl-accepting chemotaxis protein [Paenibacillus caseinilyticus]